MRIGRIAKSSERTNENENRPLWPEACKCIRRAGLVLLSNSAAKNLMRDKAWKKSQISTSKVLQT
jgi:hypothetical protein